MSTASYLSLVGSGNLDWIDARFERAVDIIQSLPKSGPIHSDYGQKLTLYGVYKQATEGNIQTGRPGMLDVLGRAKWDAWNKRKDLTEFEAKRIYVDSLITILKGFSDRSVAVAYIRELENFTLDTRSRGGTVASQLRSMHSAAQSTSSTSDSEDSLEDDRQPYQEASSSRYRQHPPASQQQPSQQPRRNPIPSSQSQSFASTSSSIRPPLPTSQSQTMRKQSAPAPVQPRERRQQTTPKRRTAPVEPAGPSRDTRGGVAPSLPGYGPPRTTVDSIRDTRRYESMSEERSRHSDDEEDEEEVRDDIFVAREGEVARATPVQRSINTLRQTPLLRPAVAPSPGPSTPGGKPPIDLALDRIQSSLTILNQRLASLESTKRKDAEEANGKAVAVLTTENPLKSLFNLIFLQLRLTSATNSVSSNRRKFKTLILDIFKSSLSTVGRATLDLLVGILILRVFKRMFLGDKQAGMAEILRKLL